MGDTANLCFVVPSSLYLNVFKLQISQFSESKSDRMKLMSTVLFIFLCYHLIPVVLDL